MGFFLSSGRSDRSNLDKRASAQQRRKAAFRSDLEGLEARTLLTITASFGHVTVAEGAAFTGVVATFTTDDPGPPALSAFSASINWGDGVTNAGTVTTAPGGGYEVLGTHTYSNESFPSVSVTISDNISTPATVSDIAHVLDAPLTISAVSITATQGTSFVGKVATFTDENPQATTGDFTATIDWGDGSTTAGIVSPTGGGGFQVTGSHDYSATGDLPVVVTVRDDQSFATTGFGNQANLTSDASGFASFHDANLVNPWGLTPTGTIWVSDNGTGVSTLYKATGQPNALVVTVPPPTGLPGPATPTGVVNNTQSSEFPVAPGKQALFIFATEDGTISAWNPGGPAGANAASLKVDNSGVAYADGTTGAVYKGLAIASQGGTDNDFLYATNFRSGYINVFNNQFQFAGSFTDRKLSGNGYGPFGIANINGDLYVTYAKQDADKHDDVAGAGNGYIDVFSHSGTLLYRFASNGPLNSPWGLAVAPSGFGQFGGDLLVGNFGNGRINAYSLSGDHSFVGAVQADGASSSIVIPGLWGLQFGGGGGSPTTLLFTAGFDDESDGLFGSISAAPQPNAVANVTPVITPAMSKISAAEGAPFSGVVATFTTIASEPTTATSYQATIDWGDGNTTTGTVTTAPDGTLGVLGTHTYADEGQFTATVTVSDPSGTSDSASGPANVFDAPLSITALPINAASGTLFQGDVATFTDLNPNATNSDFSATIDWGDGVTSTGTVSENGSVFDVWGSHVYVQPGQFPAVVSVQDVGGFIATTGIGNQTNLVSDIPGLANHTDPNLVNPWGITPTGEFWVSDNGTGVSTLYNSKGIIGPLVVTIPPPAGQPGPAAPTGIVNNSNSSEFLVAPGKPASFIFDTEDGTISAWNFSGPAGRNAASPEVDNSQTVNSNGSIGAVYKGLAIASKGRTNNDFLYATNFRSGNIDVFNNQFKPAGSFTDPSLTALGYAPFGITNVHGTLYVTFAKQDADKHDDVAGDGHGYIDQFTASGGLIRRFASNGPLNSPWGMAIAPNNFGRFGGDLLVGNFGDGWINAFNVSTGQYVGTLTVSGTSDPISIPGLWAIQFGGGGGSPTALYFTEGLNGESDGVLGKISSGPQLPNAATVTDGNVLTPINTTVHPTSGTTVNGVVGTFLDSTTLEPASNFTALIAWGDGTTSPGVVEGGNGEFKVVGTHTYALPGKYVIKVKLAEKASGTVFAVSSSTVVVPRGFTSPTTPAAVTNSTPCRSRPSHERRRLKAFRKGRSDCVERGDPKSVFVPIDGAKPDSGSARARVWA